MSKELGSVSHSTSWHDN